MEFEEKKYILAFSVFEGIGPARFKLMKDYFGSAKDAFFAPEKDLQVLGLNGKIIADFLKFRKAFNFDSYFIRLEELGIETVCLEEESYPKLLKEISDPPLVLYIRSREGLGLLEERKSIAVVGTRKMTGYGEEVTRKLTRELVEANLVIVSGLARGVDRIAHETALENNGITVAVFGTGLETVYPPEHRRLAEKIYAKGALISEFPPGAKITKGNFRVRNRIVSGLSCGVLVTEAALDSGSMITASYAAEQGREVFAVPGSISSFLSAGTASLIKKGAKLVYNVEDILEEIG